MAGLLNHMFVRYSVPPFLYQACFKASKEPSNALSNDPFKEKQELFRKWFVTLAQGGSFPKLVKPYMTSKESSVFLAAPETNRIHENVWWAKMQVAGLPVGISEKLLDRIFSHYFIGQIPPRERRGLAPHAEAEAPAGHNRPSDISARVFTFKAALKSALSVRPQRRQTNWLWLFRVPRAQCPHPEQVRDVYAGSTVTTGKPAASALYATKARSW